MQVLQDNFFYQQNPRFGSDAGLEREREVLAEQQKFCKVQARKLSLETNRRRKALEERRKQWDVQEQRLRENILQQRRQQVQDATERFQRAHLPPSQRRRTSFRRNVPNLDDALHQIQNTSSPYSRQNPSFSSLTNISSCTPSPKPPTVSKSSHRQALSAVEAYTKLLQEQSRDQDQQHSPQDSYPSDRCTSESLSCKDSLENEDLNRSTKNLQFSFSSFFLGSEKAPPDLRKQNDLCPTSDLTSFSGMMLLGDDLAQSRKLYEPKQRRQEETEWPDMKMDVSKVSWELTSVQKTPKTETQNILALCEIIRGDPERFQKNSPQKSPNDDINVRNMNTGGNRALQSSRPQQDALLKQQERNADRELKYLTKSPFPAKNGNREETLFASPSKPNNFLNDSTTDNLSKDKAPHQTSQENHHPSCQKEAGASINNLNKISNSEPKSETPVKTSSVCLSNIQSDCPEEESQKEPLSETISHSICEVRFIKGILKKPKSKYVSGDAANIHTLGHFMFAKQVALALRDSVELTRAKAREAEGRNAVKKKLRWFDEVHEEREEQSVTRHAKGKSPNPPQSMKSSSADHQPTPSAVSGAQQTGASLTPAASAGAHFTREAWADVGVQVGPSHEPMDEVKASWSLSRPGGPRVPQRERSNRAAAGPVSSRTRKGTVIRPQSATEVSQIAKTQGRMMMMMPRPPPPPPPPPPRMESDPNQSKQAPASEPPLHKSGSEVFPSSDTHRTVTVDNNNAESHFSEGNTKSAVGLDHRDTPSYPRRRGAACGEKGLCLDCTPTDEEISQLWLGVRSALTTRDGKPILSRQTSESGRSLRKASAQPPGSGNRRLLHSSQVTKQTPTMARPCPDTSFPREGFGSAAQLHLAEVHAEGLLEERDTAVSMATAQTLRPGQQQQQGLTNISLEEQKILLSLERLNHQLHCVQEHAGAAGTNAPVLVDPSYTGVNFYKRRALSANNRPRYRKKF